MDITPTFRLDADAHQYRLERVRQGKSKKDPSELVDVVDVTFHRTLRQVVARIAEYEMRESIGAAASVAEAADRFDAVVDRLVVDMESAANRIALEVRA